MKLSQRISGWVFGLVMLGAVAWFLIELLFSRKETKPGEKGCEE